MVSLYFTSSRLSDIERSLSARKRRRNIHHSNSVKVVTPSIKSAAAAAASEVPRHHGRIFTDSFKVAFCAVRSELELVSVETWYCADSSFCWLERFWSESCSTSVSRLCCDASNGFGILSS